VILGSILDNNDDPLMRQAEVLMTTLVYMSNNMVVMTMTVPSNTMHNASVIVNVNFIMQVYMNYLIY